MVGAVKLKVSGLVVTVFAGAKGAGPGPVETMVGAAKLQVCRVGGSGCLPYLSEQVHALWKLWLEQQNSRVPGLVDRVFGEAKEAGAGPRETMLGAEKIMVSRAIGQGVCHG